MMQPIQWIIIVFALFAFSRVVIRARKKDISRKEFLFWSAVWVFVMLIAIIPAITGFAANWTGVDRGIDAVVYASVIFLFYMVFRLYVKIDNSQREMTRLVRELALRRNK